MDWQGIAVLVCVAAAAAYVARQTWRTWAGRKAGCGSCSCNASTAAAQPIGSASLISPSELTARLRRR
jgi:hypothetical protein